MVACNVVAPQFFWFKRCRTSLWFMVLVSLIVNLGMWMERFVIIVTSLSGDFLPSSWGYYTPTWVDVMTFVGSLGLFFTLFLLFVRYLPVVAMAEVKTVMPQAHLSHGVHRSVGDYHGEIPGAHEGGRSAEPSENADD
jgi:molybdopterin-containing oxidoreductase family membrane subunit